jgi:RNA polymerase sigma-70 factor (ECF subfamily)
LPSGSDWALLERARQYDPVALGTIYDRYSTRIYNYIYRRVGDANLSEDLTAAVFTKMLEAIRSSKPWRTSFSGWLYRIAHNIVVDHYRSWKKDAELPLEDRLVADRGDPVDALDKTLTQDKLRVAIRQLTADQGNVILLKFVEGMSNSEVADILGKTEGAVKSLQHRALDSLRRILANEMEGPRESSRV